MLEIYVKKFAVENIFATKYVVILSVLCNGLIVVESFLNFFLFLCNRTQEIRLARLLLKSTGKFSLLCEGCFLSDFYFMAILFLIILVMTGCSSLVCICVFRLQMEEIFSMRLQLNNCRCILWCVVKPTQNLYILSTKFPKSEAF